MSVKRIRPGGGAPSKASQNPLADSFRETRDILKEAVQPLPAAAEALELLDGRLQTETFHLAVLGQFKRGKSTLLNALLGREILPSSVVPLTAIPTFVRWGENPRVRVTLDGSREPLELPAESESEMAGILADYVTEESNPKNRLGVVQVDASLPDDILSQGVVFIDTPGIGSTYQHNTETTLNFLPQCDAALFMVSADPPVTEVELVFLEEVGRVVPHLVFVFNKVDYLRPADRVQALDFFRKVLVEKAGFADGVKVFPVSALRGLEGRLAGDVRMLADSGLQEVREYLLDFLVNEKSLVLQQAVAGRAADVLGEALMQLDLTARSLAMPMENLENRLAALEERVREARGQREAAGDLLAGDRGRAAALLERQAGSLRKRAREHIEDAVAAALTGKGGDASLESRARRALEEGIPGFFERELGSMSREFEEHVAEVLEPHRKRADDLIGGVRASAAELFEIPFAAPASIGAYVPASQPYWITRKWSTSLNPVPVGLVNLFLPPGIKRAAVVRRIMKQVDALVIHNVENLRWATLQNLESAFRRFTTALDSRLADTVEATQGAIAAVIQDRKKHADAAGRRMPALEEMTSRLDSLRQRFSAAAGNHKET